jgi:hypothetical protein
MNDGDVSGTLRNRLLFAALVASFLAGSCGGDTAPAGAGGTGGSGATGGTGGTGGNGAATGGTGGGSGNNAPLTIPAGKSIATIKVAADVMDVPAGDYEATTPGFAGQRNGDEFFANFDGATPGKAATLGLRFGGFNRAGAFPCGARAKPNDDYAVQTSLELWVGVNAKGSLAMYRGSAPMSSCTVTVTKLDATVIEGRYVGMLYSDATHQIAISGEFRAASKP